MHFWQNHRVKEKQPIPLLTVFPGVKLHISLELTKFLYLKGIHIN